MFAAEPAGAFFDALYDRVALERVREPAQLDPALDVSSPPVPAARNLRPYRCRLTLAGECNRASPPHPDSPRLNTTAERCNRALLSAILITDNRTRRHNPPEGDQFVASQHFDAIAKFALSLFRLCPNWRASRRRSATSRVECHSNIAEPQDQGGQ